MVKEECNKLVEKMLGIAQVFEAYLNLSAIGDPKLAAELLPANHWYIDSLENDEILTDEERTFYKQKLADMSLLMQEGKPFSDISAIAREGKEKALRNALEKFTVCECFEMEEVSLKIPIDVSIHESGNIEEALEKVGYEVGTDGYYADPDNYYTVIVSATKKQELRRGGRG